MLDSSTAKTAIHETTEEPASGVRLPTVDDPPEVRYRNETDPAVRRRLAGQVVAACKKHIAALARKLCPSGSPHAVKDCEQTGAIGVLLALESFDPTRGVPFWAYARFRVVHEIHRFTDVGVFWSKRATRPGEREAKAEARRPCKAFDESTCSAFVHVPSAEDLFMEAELLQRQAEHLATVAEKDRNLLLCEKRTRTKGRSKTAGLRARRREALIERARAAVLGADDGKPKRVA